MNIHELFSELLDRKEIALCLPSSTAANTVRVKLVKKYNDYKEQMEAAGFLDSALAPLVVSLEWSEETQVATFFLRARKQKMIQYELIRPVGATNA